MRLKKLEILGFKSFADKTEILFDSGVTCIVGPNGCGKSNVSDSIRWVLGERSAKLLRGSTMEDVIFNGTEVRKPLAFAEVSLTIDNADRGMPIEYNEVTLTRRLYRTGESEYFLNKTLCRLKDIQDLILDTGIGSSSYSMIEQGRIDYILRADPEERRFLIEEAAGIAKYKVKKDESIRKLERTEENLKRLNDIVFEVQKNIQYAERQAKRAERYKQELEKLKQLEIKRAFFQKQQLEQKKVELEQSFQIKKDELQRLDEQIRAGHQSVEDQENRVRGIGQRCRVKEGERYQALSQIETNEQKLQFVRDKRVELAQQRGQLLQEQDQLQLGIEASRVKKEEIRALIQSQAIESAAIQTKLTEVSQQLQHQESVIQEVKSALEAARQEFFQAAQTTTRARNEYHRCKVLSENLEVQCRKEESNTARFNEQIAAWEEKLGACLRDLEAKNTELQGVLANEQELQSREGAMDQALAELRRSVHDIRLTVREKESRLHTLTEMEQASWASFQEFLNEASQQLPGLVRSLKEVLKVQEGYEWTVDVALGQFVRSFIAGDVPTARAVIGKLHASRSFAAGILVKGLAPQVSLSEDVVQFYGSLGFRPLSDFVQTETGFEGVLTGVFVIDQFPVHELERLLNASQGATFISKDGLFLGRDSRLYFWNDLHRAHFLFSRESEIAKIRQDLDKLTGDAQAAETQALSVDGELGALRSQIEAVEQQKTGLLVGKESLENTRKHIEERLHAFRGEVDLVSAEIREMMQESERARASQEQLLRDLTQKEEDEKKFQQLQGQKEKDLENLSAIREEILNVLRQQQAQVEQYQQGLKHLEESLRLVEEHAQKDQDRLVFLDQGKERIASKEQELNQDEDVCVNLSGEYQEKLRAIDVELELLRKDQREQEDVLLSLRRTLEDLAQAQKALQDEEHQISMQQMDFDYQLKNVGERLAQRYRLNLFELNAQEYVFTEEEMATAEETLQALQAKVDSLGTVNLLAIDEYQEMKQRYDFLTTQQKDLVDARESLMEAIRKINRTTKELFETTFVQVQENFKLYYQTLFRGGDAKLTLIDEQHPLESGIDIVVRPPGKKLQNMSLLSGGEKALTAVALLFALFKIRPSPFCLLDEVDAPLDEANIDRFLTVLRNFITTTQFLIITHNRKTIGMGDALYGVTMEEPGVSKIVSVKVRAGDESLPGEGLHPTVAAEEAARANQETTDTVTA
ncbi:MAG TPA: chromosome segregation protein SMC [Candidatus Omnitrophota bacterium]|nr:chromosome segregation protein SMC [Candidatus Omnitrophota bacterium]